MGSNPHNSNITTSATTPQGTKIDITFDVAWDKLVSGKQTLFSVYSLGKEERKPCRGIPDMTAILKQTNNGSKQSSKDPLESQYYYTLRSTKGVNMHPYLTIRITKADGSKYLDEEDVQLSLVPSNDKNNSCTVGTYLFVSVVKTRDYIKREI